MKTARKINPAPMESQWKVSWTKSGMTESNAVIREPWTMHPQSAVRRRREARRVSTGGYLLGRTEAGEVFCSSGFSSEVDGFGDGAEVRGFSSTFSRSEWSCGIVPAVASSILSSSLCPLSDVSSEFSTSSTSHCRAIFFSIKARRNTISKAINPKAI